jgi:ABC-type dipeptide/oligopeptide/nickel transport system permease component
MILAKEAISNGKNIILPAIVLGIRPLAVVIQLMRNSRRNLESGLSYSKSKGIV